MHSLMSVSVWELYTQLFARNWRCGRFARSLSQGCSSLSQTIWPRWAWRQFLILPIVQTLLPVTFAYSLSSEAVVIRQMRSWKRLWRRSLTHSHKRTSMELYKCIAVGGDYFEGDLSFMCVLSIKVPIRKKAGNLSYAPRICQGKKEKDDSQALKIVWIHQYEDYI